jgi:putative addiction module killer protein
MCDSTAMAYEIITTNVFDKWLCGIRSKQHRARIISRFDRIQMGNFGDHKSLGNNLFELRFFFGSGFRAYYTIKDGFVVFLLCGGNKSTQSRDIKKAHNIIDMLGLE